MSLGSCQDEPAVPAENSDDITQDVKSSDDEPAPANPYEEPLKECEFVKDGALVQGTVDAGLFEKYCDGTADAAFVRTDYFLFNMDALSDGKWEQISTLRCGGGPTSPKTLVFNDGKSWEPVREHDGTMCPTYFSVALNALNRKLGKHYAAYVSRALEFNSVENVLTTNGLSLNVIAADDNGFALSYSYDYMGGRTGVGGKELEIFKYEPADRDARDVFADPAVLCFDNDRDAYDWLIVLFHDTFGDRANLNDIYAGIAIFDNPYLNLSDLEAERDSLGNKD